jgi:hypothetical protein
MWFSDLKCQILNIVSKSGEKVTSQNASSK